MNLPLVLMVVVFAVDARVIRAVDNDVTFPLQVSADRRHLEDQTGRPFLIAGDTAWSLIAQLDPDDVTRYLDDRSRRGFTATIVNLIEHKFASNAPATREGLQPFQGPGDFGHPNPAYFDAAHRVVAEAGRRGLSVWLCPAYLGWDGGDEGFAREIVASGPDSLRAYGRFVGARFKDLQNIVWVIGGDFAVSPGQRWLGEQLQAGLAEGGARQLMTAHGGQTTAVATYGDRPWIAIETVYSYKADLAPELLAAYRQTPARPFVLIESTYEGEHDAHPAQIRRQAWSAMLSGAAGQFFGNNPIWHFDGPTLFPFAGSWQQALDSAGSRDMARLAAFCRTREWYTWSPAGDLVRATPPDVAAVSTATGRAAGIIAYIPSDGSTSPREVIVRVESAAGAAQWFNPARDEAPRRARGGPVSGGGVRLSTPGDNGMGANDWVLVYR